MYTVIAQSSNREVRLIHVVRESMEADCPALSFLKDQYQTQKAHVTGIRTLLNNYAKLGRGGLTHEQLHPAEGKKDIWRFSRGQLRLYCFFDGESIVITHGSLKKSQKTAKPDIAQAQAAKEKYLKDKGVT